MCIFWKDLIRNRIFAVIFIGGGFLACKMAIGYMKDKKDELSILTSVSFILGMIFLVALQLSYIFCVFKRLFSFNDRLMYVAFIAALALLFMRILVLSLRHLNIFGKWRK